MEIRQGSSIVEQSAVGPLRFYHRPQPEVPAHSLLTPQEEMARFFLAQRQAVKELNLLHDRAQTQVGPEAAAIFSIHAMLAEDEDLTQAVQDCVRDRHATAEWAVLSAGHSYAQTLSALTDPYMQARAADIRDVSRRLAGSLLGFRDILPVQTPAILVADQFLPSEIMALVGRALGLVSLRGSTSSHTALLLRAYHIPAVVGLDLDESWEGHIALLDGRTGTLYLDPDRPLLEDLSR